MLEFKNVGHSVSEKLLFESVSFPIYPCEKVGLVGANGAGKTTLMKIMAGQLSASRGSVFKSRNLKAFYCDLLAINKEYNSVGESICPEWYRACRKMNSLMELLERMEKSDTTFQQYQDAFDQFEKLGGYSLENQIYKLLSCLGLDNLDLETELKSLSGGEFMKVSFIPIIKEEFDLILLDEPTNNLDQAGRTWLADFIRNRKESFVIISHDRAFLDAVCTKTLVLDSVSKSVSLYSGNYSFAVKQKRIEEEKLKLHYEVQKRLIKRLEDDVKSTKEQALKTENSTTNDYIRARSKKVAMKAKARENRLNKIIDSKKVIKPKEHSKIQFSVSNISNRDSIVIKATNLQVGYSNKELLDEINLELHYGERVILLGDSATGKSTLVKTLLGLLSQLSGERSLNQHLKAEMLSQGRLHNYLDKNVLDALIELCDRDIKYWNKVNLSKHLADINLNPTCLNKKIEQLSVGERTKLEIYSAMMNQPGLIVLDEPTNHLDIESIESLEFALSKYRGALIVISHDLEFVEKISCDWIWSIEDKRLKVYSPNSYDFKSKFGYSG